MKVELSTFDVCTDSKRVPVAVKVREVLGTRVGRIVGVKFEEEESKVMKSSEENCPILVAINKLDSEARLYIVGRAKSVRPCKEMERVRPRVRF